MLVYTNVAGYESQSTSGGPLLYIQESARDTIKRYDTSPKAIRLESKYAPPRKKQLYSGVKDFDTTYISLVTRLKLSYFASKIQKLHLCVYIYIYTYIGTSSTCISVDRNSGKGRI